MEVGDRFPGLCKMVLGRKYITLLCLAWLTISVATAQNTVLPTVETSSASVLAEQTSSKNYDTSLQNIYIRYQHDKAWPRWDYANNREARAALMKAVKEIASDSKTHRAIIIEGAASPIGSDHYNQALALRRAAVLKEIISRFEGADKLKIHTTSSGEDWVTFSQHIYKEYHKPNRKEVLDIINSDDTNNEKERKLHALDKGKTWRLLVTNYMSLARNAAVVRIVENAPMATFLPTPSLWSVVAPAQLIPPFDLPKRIIPTEPPRKIVMAFRSNLLVPALNVGVEVPIGRHWSIGADYYFPWIWPKRDNKNCFELLSWGVDVRYWFGRNRTIFDRLQGHSLGLYGYIGYYDFERNFHGYQGEFLNVGIDYTYAMAVGKKKQVHFEFSLGVGYIYSLARKYTVIEAGTPLISDKITKNVGFFGPTKANISLVVPIFQKVKPQKREGGNE